MIVAVSMCDGRASGNATPELRASLRDRPYQPVLPCSPNWVANW
jgi:hypothetical protein